MFFLFYLVNSKSFIQFSAIFSGKNPYSAMCVCAQSKNFPLNQVTSVENLAFLHFIYSLEQRKKASHISTQTQALMKWKFFSENQQQRKKASRVKRKAKIKKNEKKKWHTRNRDRWFVIIVHYTHKVYADKVL